jgi:hypothetical protein
MINFCLSQKFHKLYKHLFTCKTDSMKKKSLLFTLLAGIVYLSLSSNASGPITNNNGVVIGSPGANKQSCSDGTTCHTGGASNGTIIDSVIVRDKSTNAVVESYVPGKTYAISVNAHNANLLSHFGYQALVLTGTNTNAGVLTATQASTAVKTANSYKVVEHTGVLTSSIAILRAEFEWTAPAKNTGAVTIYSMMNAVNNNALSSGDQVSQQITKTLSENLSVGDVENSISLNAYPNPVINLLKLKMENAGTGKYLISAFDMTGKLVYNSELNVVSASQETHINTKTWSAGLYQLSITKDGQKHVIPIVKQ